MSSRVKDAGADANRARGGDGRLAAASAVTAETIYALSSGRGRAGVAVIRLSGPAAWAAAEAFTGAPPADRRALRRRFRDPDTGEILDEGLCFGFSGPRSFTGEDVVEFQIHGGLAVIDGMLAALGRRRGLRMAEPGEFTRRAFENGRMDLTGAEALGDLIEAETAAQRRQALRQGGGALAALCDGWRGRLVSALAHWEAALDFSDEELPAALEAETAAAAAALRAEIAGHLADGGAGERLRDGFRLAIVGPPNAGKSSLLNALAARDVAIVSGTPGTTRDVLEVHLDLAGYPVIAADTAGLRDSAEPVEQEGVRRARRRADEADLRLAVFDAAAWPSAWTGFAGIFEKPSLIAVNKTDLAAPALTGGPDGVAVIGVSAKTGAGLADVLAAVGKAAAAGFEAAAAPVITRARHREALAECAAALEAFGRRRDRLARPEIGGEDLRAAARCLARVTGRVDVEDLLDVIFRDFCIGK